MIASQYCMFVALALILLAWAGVWIQGHRAPALQRVFAALSIQSAAAVLMSFSTESFGLSLILGATILAAVIWMIQSARGIIFRRARGALPSE